VDAAAVGRMSKALQWMTTKMEEQQVVAKAAAAVAAGDASSSARAISKMDPAAAAGFKLFGKTIAVAATTAAACVLSDAGADAGALFGMRVAAHWATAAPSCSQKNGIAMGGEEEDEQNLDELPSSSGSNSGVVDDDSTILAVLNNNKSTTTTMCGSGLLHGLQSGAEPCTDSAGLILDHQGDVCVSDSTGLILEDQGVVTQKTITTNIAVQEEEAEEEEDDDKLEICSSKPAERIMACPRCDSLDTKFCYYNNYNINQPRHFCKNCQRYWTAGGTLRNVPVGAGRRKNKQNGGGIHGPPSLLQSSSEGETVIEPSAAAHAHAHAHAAHAHHHVSQDSSSVLLQQIELSDGTQEQTSSSHCCKSASPLKISQPKQHHHHLGGLMQQLENSSSQLLLSPGGSTDSCITINNNHQSSPFSLSMSVGGGSAEAVASLHPFAAATSMMQSTDSPTRLGQKQIIKAPPPPSSSSLAAADNGSAAFGASWILSNENETGGYPNKDVDVRGNSNSTLTEPLPMQHTSTSFTGPLLPMHVSTSFTGPPPMHMVVKDGHVFQHLHSSAVYHHQQQQSMMPPTSMGDLGAGWTSNGTPFSFFSGTWPPPYGHNNNGWNNGGAAGPVPSSTTMFGSATTTMATTAGTGSLGYYAPSAQKFAPWCPAPPGTTATTLQAAGGHAHWALAAAAAAAAAPGILGTHGASSGVVLSDMKGALDHSDDNAAAAAFKACGATTTSVSGTSAGVVPWSAQGWRLKTSSGPIGGGGIAGGKRASPEGGKVEDMWGSSKLMRVVDYNNNCNTWNNNTVGIKSNPEVINNNTGNLFKAFQPRMEIQAGAGTGSSKRFYNPTQMFVNSLQFQETTTT
jgi:hypothetical protein